MLRTLKAMARRRGEDHHAVDAAGMGQPRSAPHDPLWICRRFASRTTSPKPCSRTDRAASSAPMTCTNIRTRSARRWRHGRSGLRPSSTRCLPRLPRSSSCGGGGDDRDPSSSATPMSSGIRSRIVVLDALRRRCRPDRGRQHGACGARTYLSPARSTGRADLRRDRELDSVCAMTPRACEPEFPVARVHRSTCRTMPLARRSPQPGVDVATCSDATERLLRQADARSSTARSSRPRTRTRRDNAARPTAIKFWNELLAIWSHRRRRHRRCCAHEFLIAASNEPA